MVENTGSPFQLPKPKTGPMITPQTMGSPAQGGQANPSYLQMRTPTGPAGGATQPVITPQASMMGDTVNPQPKKTTQVNMQPGSGPAGPNISPPPGAMPQPPQAGGNSLGGLYDFFKSDLQNQTKQAKSGAVADASARGVYYGTPLTGSEADIDTQYLRGLGQLDAGMYGNEQQNQLARLGYATNLLGQSGNNAPPTPGGLDFSGLGALFAGGPNNPATPIGTSPRSGPVITPQTGDKGATKKPTNSY